MFGCSELFSLFNDTFAWSGLLIEGLVIILFVVADIYRSKSPLVFCICILQQEFFYVHRISKTSRKDLYFCRLLALILFIKIDEVKSASLGSNMRFSGLKILKEGLTGNKGWTNHWRDPEPRQEYDILIIGGGGHGLSTAYYLAKNHGLKNIAVLEKAYLGGGNVGRNTTIVRANYFLPGNSEFYSHSLKPHFFPLMMLIH